MPPHRHAAHHFLLLPPDRTASFASTKHVPSLTIVLRAECVVNALGVEATESHLPCGLIVVTGRVGGQHRCHSSSRHRKRGGESRPCSSISPPQPRGDLWPLLPCGLLTSVASKERESLRGCGHRGSLDRNRKLVDPRIFTLDAGCEERVNTRASRVKKA